MVPVGKRRATAQPPATDGAATTGHSSDACGGDDGGQTPSPGSACGRKGGKVRGRDGGVP